MGRSPFLASLAAAAIVLTLVGLSFYFRTYAPPPPYLGAQGSEWFGWPFFGLGWVLIPLFLFGVLFAFRWFLWGGWRGGGWYARYDDSAVATLRERFARGEISKEQFETTAKDLQEY
jgi:uncharacterized membrane protein